MNFWTLSEAIEICTKIESVCPEFGCHVALTGGLLYKEGSRKDLDILFYRIRQVDEINVDGLIEVLSGLGFTDHSGFGWCRKAKLNGKKIDMFFPEEKAGKYDRDEKEEEVQF